MNKFYLGCFFSLIINYASAQSKPAKRDTARQLQQVTVKGYLSEQPVLSVPASVSVIGASQIKQQPDISFVNTLNTVPGIRAEERSPGSYRLSIRGSLLRSPFGVRDVKVYFDGIPLTDAGGNTYLNALDINSIGRIEVLKGPDGSLFGANSGGVVLLNTASGIPDSTYLNAGISGGSYGLFHQKAALQVGKAKNTFNLNQSYQNYDGYRENSRMHRAYFQASDTYRYGTNNQLSAVALYSDLNYKTPGGLTFAQMQANPRSARLPTATLPGAIQQKIGITTEMFLGGLTNEYHFNSRLRNVTAVFGNHINFANPFITNYEERNESTYGLRSYFELAAIPQQNFDWKLNVGVEWQQTNSLIKNYDNNAGVKGNLNLSDKINTGQHFFFTRYAADIFKRLHAEAAVSLNYYSYDYYSQLAAANGQGERDFSPQVMPRLALSYEVTNNFIWRGSVSRGYSTPTTAEIRPTNNVINTSLQAQFGWNYETGFRLRNRDKSMFLDASVFYYRLDKAIVRRLNPDETEYYINAGGANQPGVEVAFSNWFVRRNNSDFIRGLQFNTAVAVSKFKFRDYQVAGSNFSGKRLTGVPQTVIVSSVLFNLPQSLSLFVQHNYTSSIPLNDANSVYANKYHLLQAKASWQHTIGRKTKLDFFAGADNLLNQKYSLGNDLNAVGNRYFNPSPLRNYYFGMNIGL
ncbi:TonB-dependent receptor [Mucilaginibacter pallidiroseus]|uniref:TonB-dependent receptor n=1 Tax=Mucilaginibacter pallidiroseus TaxID=2599295 RepID=A0A563U582_9SPHI|nr:TonB-dependent receptor [Mucilaginibacter pallidiroseus]TWR26485.1 TonB-dependent receptor [Mucilaginibacter pallidiroseus]